MFEPEVCELANCHAVVGPVAAAVVVAVDTVAEALTNVGAATPAAKKDDAIAVAKALPVGLAPAVVKTCATVWAAAALDGPAGMKML